MALKNINPTTTKAWQKLTAHFDEIKNIHLKEFFRENSNRTTDFSITFDDFKVDYSKNRINKKTIDLLIELANEVDLKDAIHKYFSGDIINTTENRAVLHTTLRDSTSNKIIVNNIDVKPEINSALNQIEKLKTQLFPNNSWQERIDNVIPYVLSNENFVDEIIEGIVPFKDELQIVIS